MNKSLDVLASGGGDTTLGSEVELPSMINVKQRLDELDSGNYLHVCSWRRITRVLQAIMETDATRRKTLFTKAQW